MAIYKLMREIPVEEGYDVVVAGGGPAGSASAICAARLGAKVLLAEATGCLGGLCTSGLVTAFRDMANGERNLVGGFMLEVVEKMYERGFMGPQVHRDYWLKYYRCHTPYKHEGLKVLLDELATGAGVEVRFFTRVIDADVAGCKINGVVLSNVEGYRYIRAKTFIDATGDAVLADLCGAPCREAGRDTPRIMASSLVSLYAGIDWGCAETDTKESFRRAVADGHFTQPEPDLAIMFQVGRTLGRTRGQHLFNVNSLHCKSVTEGMMLGRKLAIEHTGFYRKYVPGFENIEHVTTATLIGRRESRNIVGEYELNFDDYMARRQFPDQIGVFNSPCGIHPYDASQEEYQRWRKVPALKPGECFGIPYSILVPKGWNNLWVAGRSSSSDVQVHGSIRAQPAAGMMGQAAGTAAVQSIKTGQPACDLNTADLVKTLREAGAYLPQERLSKTMTR